MNDFDDKTGDRIIELVAGLFEVPHYIRQRRLKLLLVLIWNLLEKSFRYQFVVRLDGVEFDSAPLSIKAIVNDWDRVVESPLTGWDKRFAKDVNWKRKKHKFWKPKKEDEQHVRAIYNSVVEKQ